MLFVAILAAVVYVAVSVPAPCVVSDWSEWSACQRSQTCQSHEAPETFPMTAEQKAKGQGRRSMQKLMYLKSQTIAKRHACRAAGTCPELVPPPSVTGAIVPCISGMAGAYPCSNVDMLAFISHGDLGYGENNVEGNDLWVWHDTERNDDYVIMGTTHGSSFVRVTDPVNPVVVGILKTQTQSSTWRDMKVIGNFAYIVSEAGQHGMQVFDLTRLRDLDSNPEREFLADVLYSLISNTHNIVANPDTDTVFLVGCTRSAQGTGDLCRGDMTDIPELVCLHMVDVSDPLNPTFAGCFEEDGYVHDAECVNYQGPDARYNGREICFCYNEEDFTIADVTDRNNPTMISRTGYAGAQYTHQGWVTPDRMFAVMNDELDEYYGNDKLTKTFVWSIADLQNPELVELFISEETSIDHNLYIRDNYVHQSNYEAGYRLLTINAAGALQEQAFFDVFPDRTTADFYGTWSNYPWLDYQGSPYVVVSSIDYGLFILQSDMAQIEANQAEPVTGQQTRTRNVLYNPQSAVCPALEDNKSCSPESC